MYVKRALWSRHTPVQGNNGHVAQAGTSGSGMSYDVYASYEGS